MITENKIKKKKLRENRQY